ncbi:hypothetical protein KAU11_05505, partial [Candidatus Babeliales bacterium]|nr:hypothetical protein [Candidatus Babeliales bacterium]
LTYVDSVALPTGVVHASVAHHGNYVAVGCFATTDNLRLFSFNSTGFTEITAGRKTQGSNVIHGVAFSPCDRFLAVVSYFDQIFFCYPVSYNYSLIENNSWAILNLGEREISDSWAIANIDERESADSSAIVRIQADMFPGPSLIYENSWAIEAFDNQLTSDETLLVENSWAILNINDREQADSSAIVRIQAEVFPNDYTNPSRVYENSWGILSFDERLDVVEPLIVTNAGNISDLDDRVTINEGDISTHESEITALQDEVAIMFGSIDNNFADLWFDSNTTLSYDISLSGDHKMHILDNLTLDGAGHVISFPRSADDVLTVADSKTVIFENCLLERYSETNVSRSVSADIVFGTGTRVALTADEDLAETWKFDGSSQLSGNGKTLDLDSGGEITVQAGADLTVSNLTIAGLSGTNLSCADDDASIKCRNVNFTIPSVYNFEHGSLEIGEQVNVCGKGIFVYESPETSTLLSQSELKFGPEMTFSYDPSAPFDHLLYFIDSTSQLHLDGARLYVTWTGLELKTGTLKLSGKNYSYNDATAALIESEPPKHGLALGDGVESLYIDIQSGASLQVASGYVNYKNFEYVSPTYLLPAIIGLGDTLSVPSFSGTMNELAWSPSGNHIALVRDGTSDNLYVYSFDGTTFSLTDKETHGGNANLRSVDWHLNGNYIVVGGNDDASSYNLKSYSVTNGILSLVDSVDTTRSDGANRVRLNPAGTFLAVCSGTDGDIDIFSFNGSTGDIGSSAIETQAHGAKIVSCDWSPDGNYLAICGETGTGTKNLRVYSFNGVDTLTEEASTELNNITIYNLRWNPNGEFLGVCGYSSGDGDLRIVRFYGGFLTTLTAIDRGMFLDATWDSEGRYVPMCGLDYAIGNLFLYELTSDEARVSLIEVPGT